MFQAIEPKQYWNWKNILSVWVRLHRTLFENNLDEPAFSWIRNKISSRALHALTLPYSLKAPHFPNLCECLFKR